METAGQVLPQVHWAGACALLHLAETRLFPEVGLKK
jgi:hypothetical protein